jgi:UDP-N-acetylmuramate dehydrogenase
MKVIHDVPLSNYTTMHVGGPAQTLITLEENDSLATVLAGAQKPLYVLGYGANCLISDKGLHGTVILNRKGAITQLSPTRLKADSGVNWDDFVQKCLELNLYGLEFTSGIPGGVGAAVAGNIAAYGQSVSGCFMEATMFDTANGKTVVWNKDDFAFTYRGSRLQIADGQNMIVLDATFELSRQPTGDLEYESAHKVAEELGLVADSLTNRRTIILETRRRVGSLQTNMQTGPYNAGSFFKNPVVNEDQVEAIISFEETGISRQKLLRQNQLHSGNSVRVSAAHVLLAAGFKRGQSWGNVRLHPDHILKLENTGHATAQELYDVIQKIIATVQKKLNITLEPEVRFLGDGPKRQMMHQE